MALPIAGTYQPSDTLLEVQQPWVVGQVETLRLSWCKLGSGDGATAVADLLLFNSSLTTVDLRGNNLGDPGAFQVARALRELTNEKLSELDLGYNEIKDEGACQLALVSDLKPDDVELCVGMYMCICSSTTVCQMSVSLRCVEFLQYVKLTCAVLLTVLAHVD